MIKLGYSSKHVKGAAVPSLSKYPEPTVPQYNLFPEKPPFRIHSRFFPKRATYVHGSGLKNTNWIFACIESIDSLKRPVLLRCNGWEFSVLDVRHKPWFHSSALEFRSSLCRKMLVIGIDRLDHPRAATKVLLECINHHLQIALQH